MVPPCSSTIHRAIDRPSPAPSEIPGESPDFVWRVRDGSPPDKIGIEDVHQLVGWNAKASVRHRQSRHDDFRAVCHRDVHDASGAVNLIALSSKNHHDLTRKKSCAVAEHRRPPRTPPTSSRTALRSAITRAASAASEGNVVQEHALPLDRPLARVRAKRAHEQIPQRCDRQPCRILLDTSQRAHILFLVARTLKRDFGSAPHDGEWSAKLVRGVGHEARFICAGNASSTGAVDADGRGTSRRPRASASAASDVTTKTTMSEVSYRSLQLDLIGQCDCDSNKRATARQRHAVRHAHGECQSIGRVGRFVATA